MYRTYAINADVRSVLLSAWSESPVLCCTMANIMAYSTCKWNIISNILTHGRNHTKLP